MLKACLMPLQDAPTGPGEEDAAGQVVDLLTPTTLESIPEELLLEILRMILPKEASWSVCGLVCKKWAQTVDTNRTIFKASLRGRSPNMLTKMISAAEKTAQPITHFCIQFGMDFKVLSTLTEDSIMRMEQLLTRASQGLVEFELSGISQGTSLDTVLLALAQAQPRALRRLNLNSSAFGSETIGTLLDAVADGLLADGTRFVSEPASLRQQHHPEPSPLTASHGGAEHMASAEEALPYGLSSLHLQGNGAVDDAFVSTRLARAVPHLTELSLANCISLSAGAVAELVGSSRGARLTSLDLSSVRLTPSALRACLASESIRRCLRSLSLSGFTSLPADAFREALCACEGLTAIDFSASLLSDAAICAAATASPANLSKLRDVRLSECSALTDRGVHELVSKGTEVSPVESWGQCLHPSFPGPFFPSFPGTLCLLIGSSFHLCGACAVLLCRRHAHFARDWRPVHSTW